MAKFQASWKSALTPQKAPTYGNQSMLIASPKELQVSNVDYVVVFEGTKKYHLAIADVINPWTLHVIIPEHDIAEEVLVKVYTCQENNVNVLTHLKFTYISQMEHAIAKFLAHSASDAEVAEKIDAVWTVCLGKDHSELWDKRLAQAFAQLELPIEWSLVGDILQSENENHRETLLHFAAYHGLKELINVFLDLPGAKRALCTYNKSGLLPRDVARECGRLDLVELLDAERSPEPRKSGTFKDGNRRKVRRNNDSGSTTITNFRNHNIQDDIQILRELNKLKSKRNSPVNRHSWPAKIQSFNPDEYFEDLDKELNKGDAHDAKQYFMDENLVRLRDITEEIYNLRMKNAEEASKEISFVAEQNRRPTHSRRLSCPASVERRKRAVQGLSNLQSRAESIASERYHGNQDEPTVRSQATTDLVFSTPPHSPPADQLIDLASPTITSPMTKDKFPSLDNVPETFMTPMSTSPTSSPLPPSPLPISLKFSDFERPRPSAGRKDRPRTWYGGAADVPLPDEDDELLFRRSNSLEDFAKVLEDVSDDDESQTSEANSKEGLLQTMSSLTEKASRTESFVSSISDLSASKESVGSDIDECEQLIQEGIENASNENIKDNDCCEGIQQEHRNILEPDEINEHSSDIEEQTKAQQVVEGDEGFETGISLEYEEVKQDAVHEDIESDMNLKQTAGGDESIEDLECRSTEHENEATKRECIVSEHDSKEAESEIIALDDVEYIEQSEDSESATITAGGEEGNQGNESKLGGDTVEPQECSEEPDKDETNVVYNEQNRKETNVINNDVERDVQKPTERHVEDENNKNNESQPETGSNEEVESTQQFEMNDDETSKLNEVKQNSKPELKLEDDDVKQVPDLEDYEDTLLEQKKIGGELPSENIPTTNSSKEQDAQVDDKQQETEQTRFEDNSNESKLDEAQDQTKKPESRQDVNEPEEPDDIVIECEGPANGPEVGTDDPEDRSESTDDNSSLCQTKIKFEDINDIDCEVKDFCLPGQNTERNKELFRIQATDDVESGEDSDQGKHIRFDEERSESPLTAEEKSPVKEDTIGMFRQRSALLLGVKAPVKRTGSDVSVTSLQDVQLDMAHREGSISPGALNASRKAKSFGDLSTFSEGRSEMSKIDDDESEEERRRFREDQAQLSVLSRVKKLENASKYASNETLDQISKSSVIQEHDEDVGKRRWSNFWNNPRNTSGKPKPAKKPGRTPTFRRDALRSSMSSIGKSSKNSEKSTIGSLVAGPHSAAFAKHSQTAPNLHVNTAGRPRSYTGKDSPGAIRKSPTVSSLDSEEQKPDSPEEAEIPSEDIVFDVDSDLENFDVEPEAWSVTVDKKTLKKMNKSDIKRQDVILELIQTEGHHVRTLKIMQQVFYRGLNKVANYPAERLDELFPRINDLVDISARFHRNLRCRRDEAQAVMKIGDVIIRQFSGDSGELVRQAYGEFVSKHPEAVALYKHLFKTDKKFSNFIKKCHGHRIVRRLSIPECFTLVTQRMTKYPLLIEAILKVTKPSHADHKDLHKALGLVKNAAKAVDSAIEDYKKQTKLKDIKMRIEKGSVVLKNGIKIKNSRFTEYQSKMIHDGILQWKNARGKLTETHVVLLESMVAFLQENDKKYSLLAIDGKSPCIALKTLMVREVATDKCAIYFVSTSKKGPEMYEFVCSSQKEKRQWCAIITEAIAKAPEDTGDLFHSQEEEKRLAEERLKRRNEILEIMKGKDKELSDLVDEKNKLVNEMKDLWLSTTDSNGKSKDDEKITSTEKARSTLLSVIHRMTQLTADTVLHESHSDSELAAATYDKKVSSPKRAETFGGFDRRPSQKNSRRQTTTIPEGKLEENHVSQRRDSGLSLASESVVGLNTLSQGQEVAGSSSFQMLEALQWVLVQFSQQETALETLRVEFQATTDEIKKLRSLKIQNDKNQFLMKEEHQAELTRQKKAYSDLERTFNTQVSDLKLKLSSQQQQQETLLKNFVELRQALTEKR